jgi:hypothetical protein
VLHPLAGSRPRPELQRPGRRTAGSLEANDGGTGTSCAVSQDSSDDGVLDLDAGGFFPAAAGGHEDVSSDSDFDGCPDKDEVDGDAECNGDPYDPDDNTNGTIDGAENRGGTAAADWRDSVVTEPQTSSFNFNNNGSPDSDGDGCSNRRETTLANGTGGNRDALNPYDFPDVPNPTGTVNGTDGKKFLNGASIRDKAINLSDVGAVLAYVGRTNTNAGASYYNSDYNNDGKPDGRQMDRTPGTPGTNEEFAGDLAISLTDVGVALEHVGDSCFGLP